jgi:hypothetical protein
MRDLHQPDPDLHRVEGLVKHDPELSYKLLRSLNSAEFGFRSPVRALWRAITFLGQRGLRAWATVFILADHGSDRPFDLVVTSVTRGAILRADRATARAGRALPGPLPDGSLLAARCAHRPTTGRAPRQAPAVRRCPRRLVGRAESLPRHPPIGAGLRVGSIVLADQLFGSLGPCSARIPSFDGDAATRGNQSHCLA